MNSLGISFNEDISASNPKVELNFLLIIASIYANNLHNRVVRFIQNEIQKYG